MKKIINKIAKNVGFLRIIYVACIDVFHLNNVIWERFNNKLASCNPSKNRKLSSKDIHRIYRDFLNCWIKDDYNMSDYFTYEFIRLNKSERNTYISDSYRFVLDSKVNQKAHKDDFENKAKFNNIFKKYMHRELLAIEGEADKERFFEFCERHKRICIKPRSAHRGMGVEILNVSEISDTAQVWEKVCENKMIVEEVILQHPVLAKLHPSSINTIRVSTAVDKSKNPHIMACCLRIGVDNNCIDNFSGGGIVVPVNISSGMIDGMARDLDANYYAFHPTTGELLVGLQIPEWESLKKTVLEVAAIIPEMRYIGWDFSLNQNGKWELIEGNNPGGVHTLQLASGRGLKKEYDDILLS